MTTIGFIGLGHMGLPMAQNLLKAGYQLCVFDVVKDAANALIAEGANRMDSVAQLAESADIIFTSVQTGKQVREICLGATGLFAHIKPHSLYIDCSSIEIGTTRELHHEAAAAQIAMLDAPVSGGVAGAQAATLTFMVGGEEQDYKNALPILSSMGKKIIYAGPSGSGQAAKICNNLLLGISMLGVSEAFSLAKQLGLDQKKFYEISSNASGQCWSMTSYCPEPDIIPNVPANNNYAPGFMTKMMLKDLYLAQTAGEEVSAFMPLGSLATALYRLFVNQGYGELDFSGIIKLFNKL